MMAGKVRGPKTTLKQDLVTIVRQMLIPVQLVRDTRSEPESEPNQISKRALMRIAYFGEAVKTTGYILAAGVAYNLLSR